MQNFTLLIAKSPKRILLEKLPSEKKSRGEMNFSIVPEWADLANPNGWEAIQEIFKDFMRATTTKYFLILCAVLCMAGESFAEAPKFTPITPAEGVFGYVGMALLGAVSNFLLVNNIYYLFFLCAVLVGLWKSVQKGSLFPVAGSIITGSIVLMIFVYPTESLDPDAVMSHAASLPEVDIGPDIRTLTKDIFAKERVDNSPTPRIMATTSTGGGLHTAQLGPQKFPSRFYMVINSALDAIVHELIALVDKGFLEAPGVAQQAAYDSTLMANFPDPAFRKIILEYNMSCYRQAIKVYGELLDMEKSAKANSRGNITLGDGSMGPSSPSIQSIYANYTIMANGEKVQPYKFCVERTTDLYNKLVIEYNNQVQSKTRTAQDITDAYVAWKKTRAMKRTVQTSRGAREVERVVKPDTSILSYFKYLIDRQYTNPIKPVPITTSNENAPESGWTYKAIAVLGSAANVIQNTVQMKFIQEAMQLQLFPLVQGLILMLMMMGFPFVCLYAFFKPLMILDYFKWLFWLKCWMFSLCLLQKTEDIMDQYFGWFSPTGGQMTILLEQALISAPALAYLFINIGQMTQGMSTKMMGSADKASSEAKGNIATTASQIKGAAEGLAQMVPGVGQAMGGAKAAITGLASKMVGGGQAPDHKSLYT